MLELFCSFRDEFQDQVFGLDFITEDEQAYASKLDLPTRWTPSGHGETHAAELEIHTT